MKPVQGLHHITAVAGDPQRNINFYHHLLGQRMIKKTVNFDDPGTYHFYFGDEIGTPGTLLTFFPWQHMGRGTRGNGETAAVAYSIAPESVAYWQQRLAEHGVSTGETQTRFDATVLPFHDPDGMPLELIADAGTTAVRHWADGPVPAVYALQGFHGVTLWLDEVAPTAKILTEQLAYTFVGQEGNRYRYQGAAENVGLYVDILHRPGQGRGRFGAGSIHHIAFRTVDDEEQLEYLQKLRGAGLRVTPVQDRQYFHSIYFREPGGVLFEIATDAPGFLYDEPAAELGTHLKLPPWYEPHRAEIEAVLPPVSLHAEAASFNAVEDGS